MAKETRAAIAEQARVFTFLGFLGSAGCWFGFALELHAQLPPGYPDAGFGIALALWLVGAVMSTVLLITGLGVAWSHRYLEAAPSAQPGSPASLQPAVPPPGPPGKN